MEHQCSTPANVQLPSGYPMPSWSDFPGCAAIKLWVDQLVVCCDGSRPEPQDISLIGFTGIIEHRFPRQVEALSQLIAKLLGLPFKSIDPEYETLPEVADDGSARPNAVLFLHPGGWQEAENGSACAPRLDTPAGQVRKLLERNFRSPSFVVLTSCLDFEAMFPPLRRISGFSRVFELPCPSPEELGDIFIKSCESIWLSDEVVQNPRRVGLLLASNYEGFEGRLLARQFANRIAVLEGRPVLLKDFATLGSLGPVESRRTLPTLTGFAERVAWHEAGHAAIAMLDSAGAHIPDYLTIVPRLSSQGFMSASRDHTERRHLAYTRSMMSHDLRVGLAGRAVEEMIYGKSHVSDLAAHDLERVSEILKSGVLKYGFQFASDKPPLPSLFIDITSGDTVFAQVQSNHAWREFLEREYQIALEIAQSNRPLVEMIHDLLLQDRVLFRDELESAWFAYNCQDKLLCANAA